MTDPSAALQHFPFECLGSPGYKLSLVGIHARLAYFRLKVDNF